MYYKPNAKDCAGCKHKGTNYCKGLYFDQFPALAILPEIETVIVMCPFKEAEVETTKTAFSS